MKIIGLIGGTGPETTVLYYQRIIALYREQTHGEYPVMVINSINATALIASINGERLDEVVSLVLEGLERLAKGGADFAAIAANTPHIVFDQIRERSPLPLLSIVEAAADAAEDRGMHRFGLLGTKFTMEATFYPEVFESRGLKLIVPQADERAFVHEKYMGELFYNVVREDTRHELTGIVTNMRERDSIEAVILGGTELSLIITGPECGGVPVLDTTQIHVDRIVREALSQG